MKKSIWLLLFFAFACIFLAIDKQNVQKKNNSQEMFYFGWEAETAFQDFKVLVIELDPILYSIQDTKLYGKKNDGHPRASEYLGFDINQNIKEMEKDLEDTSHHYLNVSIKREHLNEFPTYKWEVAQNLSGDSVRFDEATYIDMSRSSENEHKGSRNKLHDDSRFKIYEYGKDKYGENYSSSYLFDYDYLINRLNLAERKKQNEFDQVWVFAIEPGAAHETIMIGSTAYSVNGPGLQNYMVNDISKKIDCDNFITAFFNIERRDSALHALGHSTENILKAVFSIDYSYYRENVLNVSTIEEYNQLNWYEKFFLNRTVNQGTLTSVGDVHFPFNAEKDYDYSNSDKVLTNWEEWEEYPDIRGDFVEDNSKAFLKYPINSKLGKKEEKNPDRLFMRFWYYLMPHVDGYTRDGYLNNWWKYFYSLDYVESISQKEENIIANVGDVITFHHTLQYHSGKTETIEKIGYGENVHISDDTVANFFGRLLALKDGMTDITIYYDGHPVTYHLTVGAVSSDEKTSSVSSDRVNPVTNGEDSSLDEPEENEVKTFTAAIITIIFFLLILPLVFLGIAMYVYFYLKKKKND